MACGVACGAGCGDVAEPETDEQLLKFLASARQDVHVAKKAGIDPDAALTPEVERCFTGICPPCLEPHLLCFPLPLPPLLGYVYPPLCFCLVYVSSSLDLSFFLLSLPFSLSF